MVLTEENPFTHETHSKDCPECRLWYAWERGQKVGKNNGQLHPSPQTIKKIQTNFAEKVEKKLEKLERELNKTSQFGRGMQMGYHKVLDVIDNTLKEKGED